MAADLQRYYSELQRSYHTLEHINFMLDAFNPEAAASSRHIIELAIWFHDCVYDPVKGGPWNERESMRIWEQFVDETRSDAMVCKLPLLRIKQPVSCLIEATISHHLPATLPPPLQISDAAMFLDLDMGILAAAPAVYAKYAHAIRTEYSHYADADYRAGRAKVLQNFLARDRIFIGEGTEKLESRARDNVRGEIVALTT
ncbi:hypothetical protein C8F01DRAFT_995711 [Mycena amicta]|nr:hypothetical protein C8F01DRAFT_995711 [Mycena amicta]